MFDFMGRTAHHRCFRLVRAGTSTPSPANVSDRSNAFAATVESCGSATLVTTRDGATMDNWLLVEDRQAAGDAALNLAQAVGARSDETVIAPTLDAPVIGWLEARSGPASRATQVGTDPAEVSRRLSVAMKAGSWVAVTLRTPSAKEIRRSRLWYEHRLGTGLPQHHTSGTNTLVASFFAGAESAEEVRSLLGQLAATLPGFDVTVRVRVASELRPVLGAAGVGAAGFAGALAATGSLVLANLIALPGAAAAGLLATGRVRTRSKRLTDATDASSLPVPKRWIWGRVRAPQKGDPHLSRLAKGSRDFDGDYPLPVDVFHVGPAIVAGIVAPQAGAVSGATTVEARAVPALLTERIGPAFALGPRGEKVHVAAADGYEGFAIMGEPGSGKSQLVRSLFAWHCLERVQPAGVRGWPGSRNALIAFESKDHAEADSYRRWAEGLGDRTVIVDVGDPESWAIDLFSMPDETGELASAEARATWVLNAMIYAFPEGSIQGRSSESIKACLTGGFAVTDAIAVDAGIAPGRSAIFYAHILAGAQGDAKGLALATAIAQAAVADERAANARSLGDGTDNPTVATTDTGIAAERLGPIYGTAGSKVSESARRGLLEASRNKWDLLGELEHWWSPKRRSFTWDHVLEGHRSVVVNTGTSATGRVIDDQPAKVLSAMLLFGLKSAIQRRSSGWKDQGRAVTVFSDELSLLAPSSPEVISWLRNQGRYSGVRLVLATQYPEQLDPQVRMVFRQFGSLLTFRLGDAGVIGEIVTSLSLGGDEWTSADVKGLERHAAIFSTSVDGRAQPPVPVTIPYFERDLVSDPGLACAEFQVHQGWVT